MKQVIGWFRIVLTTRRGATRTRWLARLIAVGATGVLLTTVNATSAAAALPRANGTALIYAAPYATALLEGAVPANTPIATFCWLDAGWTYSPYPTNRWFQAQAPGWDHRTGRVRMLSGYVPASNVWDQQQVGHCPG